MFATDFVFNGQRASDFNLFIGGEGVGDNTTTGGELSLNSVRPPDGDVFVHYSSTFDSPLIFTVPVIKVNCSDMNDIYFDQYEESAISKWLLQRKGYKWLQFDQDGYEDIYYKVMCTSLTPEQVGGRTIGFTITFTSNCAYGWSKEYKKEFTLNSSTPYEVYLRNDIDTYIKPYITINFDSIPESFDIKNESDTYPYHKKTEITNISTDEIFLDCDNEIIEGIESPDTFNYHFIKLVQGLNKLKTSVDTDTNIIMKYRESRRVII